MTDASANGVGVNIPAQDLNGPQVANSVDFMQKYGEERDKRTRADGVGQYIDLRRSEKYTQFIEDPWVEAGTPIYTPVQNDGRCKVLVLGAGFGGILYAVRLIRAGVSKDDIVIVDPAGGFGGTWYWNRYPGLMCDVESHIYLPLIEEMEYMPKRKYASGFEIRAYVESICSKYGLHERAMFQSSVKSMIWNEKTNEWDVKIAKKPKGGEDSEHVIHANFVPLAPGLLSNAKLPDIPGIDTFKGHMFHTARWDYQYTGGNPNDAALTGLEGKRVGIVGTGATCVQALPQVAKYASKVYVFQRTPSAVDSRNNHDTDANWFKSSIATKAGWHRERNLNFIQHVENNQPKPERDLVNDNWTKMGSYSGLIGSAQPVTMENVGEYVGQLHALDIPRQTRLHARIDGIVEDAGTAEKLKPWYSGWCKRPCFHDEYLQAFNRPSVELVDTDGKGLDGINHNGIRAGGKEYEVDVIIWSTGFRSPALGSAASKAEITVTGRNGLDMEEQSNKGELLTLHGILGRGFPNVFWTGPYQAGTTANNTFTLDVLVTHAAYIIAQTIRNTKEGKSPVVEPTEEAQAQWAMQIMAGAATFAGMAGCTPSYLNREGELNRLTPEQQMMMAKIGIWPHGFVNYINLVEQWRADEKMEGLEVSVAA